MRYDEFKTVRIPVRVVDNQITYFYSGRPLHVKDRSIVKSPIDDDAAGPRLHSLLQRQSLQQYQKL